MLGYIRNTEFFHPAEEGRTRFGALVGLRRGYELKNGRNAELGLMANQSFGAAPQMLPWVVLRAKGAGYQIQFGSIADRGARASAAAAESGFALRRSGGVRVERDQ